MAKYTVIIKYERTRKPSNNNTESTSSDDIEALEEFVKNFKSKLGKDTEIVSTTFLDNHKVADNKLANYFTNREDDYYNNYYNDEDDDGDNSKYRGCSRNDEDSAKDMNDMDN